MRSTLLALVAFLTFVASHQTHAVCSLKTAQEKMMAVNNMAQVYNRKIFDYMEDGKEAPADLLRKQTEINEETNEIGLKLAAVSEENPSQGYENPIDEGICQQYDAVMEKHAPDNYVATPINRQDTTDDPNCNSTILWERFGVSIQQQVELTQAGKITDEEAAQYMRLTTQIGELSTTDLKKACDSQTAFEQKLASE